MESEFELEEWIDGEDLSKAYEEDLDDEGPKDQLSFIENSPKQSTMLAKWLCLFLLKLQAVYRIASNPMNALFRFLSAFLHCLCLINAQFKSLAKIFPKSTYMARKLFGKKVILTKYVVCPRCFSLSNLGECVSNSRIRQQPETCSFKRFPNHRQKRMRKSCQQPLLKSVHMAGGRSRLFYPFLVYCYLGVDVMLQYFLDQPSFSSNCEKWRSIIRHEDYYHDVYDGQVWKDFQVVDGVKFLAEKNNFAITLNMDFFQPYKHIKGYSVGAIYAVVLNLPREIRYKRENTILIGLIPGPKEPEHNINTFLNPLVKELIALWSGKSMQVVGKNRLVKCALLCVACDLPAGRKTCGFLGHSAHYGCSKCWKFFPGTVGGMDYSGFDRKEWSTRNGTDHRRIAMGLRNFNSLKEQVEQESAQGLRYSALLMLPYFNAPRMLIVDPMHNLFLGTAKHFLQHIWVDCSVLNDQTWEILQSRVDSILVPPGIGRIPFKIKSGFSSFTADQWKNWTIYYSLIALHGLVGENDLECWRHFVLACRLLCRKSLSKQELKVADLLLMQFCKRTERMYGKKSVTPNMHMHGHLKECVIDYGPLHSFWLYAFERYNGILESIPNNNRSIECQLFNRFIEDNRAISDEVPLDVPENLKPHFSMIMQSSLLSEQQGSLADTLSSVQFTDSSDISNITTWEFDETVMQLPSNRSRYLLSKMQIANLKRLYLKLNPSISPNDIEIPSVCSKYSFINFKGKVLGTYENRSRTSAVVAATWLIDVFGDPISAYVVENPCIRCMENKVTRPVRINSFLLHCPSFISSSGTTKHYLLASVSWYQFHKEMNSLGKPMTVWCSSVFEPEDIYSIVPVQLISSRIVTSLIPIMEENLLVVCPCIDF